MLHFICSGCTHKHILSYRWSSQPHYLLIKSSICVLVKSAVFSARATPSVELIGNKMLTTLTYMTENNMVFFKENLGINPVIQSSPWFQVHLLDLWDLGQAMTNFGGIKSASLSHAEQILAGAGETRPPNLRELLEIPKKIKLLGTKFFWVVFPRNLMNRD